jgi:transposase-like protein
MTTKQIAKAVGKDERTIRRWVNQASDRMSSLSDKMSEAERTKKQVDFSQEETLAIIEVGMGPDAAGIYRANVTRSPAIAVSASLVRECRMAYREGVLSKRAVYHLLKLDSFTDTDMPSPGTGRGQTEIPLLEERTKGLEFYQRIAESSGLVKSDRDDLIDTYRR